MMITDLNNQDFQNSSDDFFSNKEKKEYKPITNTTVSLSNKLKDIKPITNEILKEEECIFCSIAKKAVPANVIFEDEHVIAFNDTKPVAPVHVLIIPKAHIDNINNIDAMNSKYIAKIFEAIPIIAKRTNIFKDGYRVISNTGENGGQLVNHLHFHLIGGRNLGPKIIQ